MAPSWLTRHRAVRTGLASSRVRFEQRAADVRRRPARLIAALMSVVVVAAVVAWLVFFSSVLALREVRVEGVEEADKAAVLAAVTVPPGTPLARVDLAAVTAAVAKVAVVREAHLTRSWPDALTVTVYPRVPLVALRNSDGSFSLVDDQAASFRIVQEIPAGVIPVNREGSAPATAGLRAVLQVLQVMPAEQRVQVSDITVSGSDLVTFTLAGVKVVWGGPSDPEKKLRVLTILMGTKPASIDVSPPDTPVTR